MQEATNDFRITGKLLDMNFNDITTRNGQEAFTGNLTIEVIDKISENDKRVNNFKVRLFTFKTTKDGRESKIYKSYKTIQNEYKTSVEHPEDPDYVSVLGSIGYNVFVGRDGNVVENNTLDGRFVNRVNDRTDLNESAIANVDLITQKYTREIKDNKPTGYVNIEAITVGYNDRGIKLMNVKYKTEADMSSTVPELTTIKATIKLNDYNVVTQREAQNEKVLFGTTKNIVNNTDHVHNLELVGATYGSHQYNTEEISTIKNSINNQYNQNSVQAPKTEDKKINVDDSVLPF